jgi:hypothetical protein
MRRATTTPTTANTSRWTHVNIATISKDGGTVSSVAGHTPRAKSAVPRTVGV